MARRLLIRGACVVTMDRGLGELPRGDVLVEGDTIAAVAPRVEASDCEVLDASRLIALPGLVDAHRHLWYTPIRGLGMDMVHDDLVTHVWPRIAARYTPEDVHAATRAGIAEALLHGITTVLDWCHVVNTPEHAEEAVRAHRSLPGRAVFAYGSSMRRKLDELRDVETPQDWGPARRLRSGALADDSARLTMALALQGPDTSPLEATRVDVETARGLGVPATMHVGVPQGGPSRRSVARLHEAGLLGPDLQFVHCCGTTDEELRLLADAGAVVTACPMCELGLGMGLPPTGRFRAAGLRPSFSADTVLVSSGDLFDEARTGLLAQRALTSAAAFAEGREVTDAAELAPTAREALEAITTDAAAACWLGDRIGSLSPGKRADVILLRADAVAPTPPRDVVGALVAGAHGRDVDTVLVDGEVVVRGGRLVGVDLDALLADAAAARDRLLAAAAEPVSR